MSIKIIILEDLVIEILHNPNLTNKPYLLRCTTWNDKIEVRLTESELSKISDTIHNIVGDGASYEND